MDRTQVGFGFVLLACDAHVPGRIANSRCARRTWSLRRPARCRACRLCGCPQSDPFSHQLVLERIGAGRRARSRANAVKGMYRHRRCRLGHRRRPATRQCQGAPARSPRRASEPLNAPIELGDPSGGAPRDRTLVEANPVRTTRAPARELRILAARLHQLHRKLAPQPAGHWPSGAVTDSLSDSGSPLYARDATGSEVLPASPDSSTPAPAVHMLGHARAPGEVVLIRARAVRSK